MIAFSIAMLLLWMAKLAYLNIIIQLNIKYLSFYWQISPVQKTMGCVLLQVFIWKMELQKT